MKKAAFIILLIGMLSVHNLKAQNKVSFFEEHIDFSIDKDYFTINGIYSFCNHSGVKVNQTILFPFAVEVTEIDSIRIVNLKTSSGIGFNPSGKLISFTIPILPNDTVDINLFYRQKTSVSNKYIITSTKAWGKPLEKADYSLTADKDISIKTFSYTPDSFNKKRKIYFWHKENFMPETDFIVTLND